MPDDVKDITIIGGGPTGLFAAFYAGMRGMDVRIVDSLPDLGGQLTALYPEKHIFDVGGFPKVLARDLARQLSAQALQFDPEVLLDEEVSALEREDGHFVLRGRTGDWWSRSIVICAGKGAFEPKVLKVPGYQQFLHKGVHYAVRDPGTFEGRKVLVVGGGDSALDWALILKDRCERLILAHRREGFRAHEKTVAEMRAACEAGAMELWSYHEVREIHGGERVDGVTVYDNRTDEDTRLDVDAVLTFLGFKPDLGPIKEWDLELAKNRVVVNHLMETNVAGVYAAGDIASYEGKLDLIATGFAEAAIAVNNAVHFVDPGARVNPGHSTNMKVFKESRGTS
ncbi:MAG: NAD(P)/FAD-dependent oxidoreductase [Gemmatimonadota bacterium]|jgi:thioredoxin reductase (NADPH)